MGRTSPGIRLSLSSSPQTWPKPRRYWHNPLGWPPGCPKCGRVESHHMDPCENKNKKRS